MSEPRLARRQRLWLGVPLVLALLALAWGMSGSAAADDTGFRMTLNARGDGVTCDEPSEPTECIVPLAGQFTLAVELFDPPDEGYVALVTQIDFHGLTWVPAPTADENTWPDNALPLRSPEAPLFGINAVGHGGLTASSFPFPVSHHEGSVVEIALTCTEDAGSFEMALVNFSEAVSPNGAQITMPPPTREDVGVQVASKSVGERDLDLTGDGITTTVPVADVLMINCQVVPPTPTPTNTTQPPAGPTATAAAGATGLPPTGYGGGSAGDSPVSLLIVGVLVSTAGVFGLSGWRLARSRAK